VTSRPRCWQTTVAGVLQPLSAEHSWKRLSKRKVVGILLGLAGFFLPWLVTFPGLSFLGHVTLGIEQHHGRIEVANVPEGGAAFTVHLPTAGQ